MVTRALRTVHSGISWGATYIGDDAANDNLLLTSGLHGGTEVGVVHGVDLAIPANDGDVGEQFGDLRDERTVGAFVT